MEHESDFNSICSVLDSVSVKERPRSRDYKGNPLLLITRSKVEAREEFREFVSRRFLARSARLSCQGACMPTFNQEFSEILEGSRNRCLLFSAVAPSEKSFSIYRINSIESAIEPFIGFCINRANNLSNHPLTHTRWLRNSIMCEKNKPEISFRWILLFFFSCSSSRRLFPLRRRAFVPSPEKVDEQNLIQSILMPSLHFPQSKNAFEVRGRNWLTKGSGLLFKLNRSDSILDRSEG